MPFTFAKCMIVKLVLQARKYQILLLCMYWDFSIDQSIHFTLAPLYTY